jgi:hypothetical protein
MGIKHDTITDNHTEISKLNDVISRTKKTDASINTININSKAI